MPVLTERQAMPLQSSLELGLSVIYAGILLYCAWMDLRERRIPNRAMAPGIALALAGMFLRPGPGPALLGGFIGLAYFFLPVLIFGPERAGMGDVKLALFIGLILGFPVVIYALAVAFVAALIVILPLLVLRKVTLRSTIPFGPFLAAGGLVGLLLV